VVVVVVGECVTKEDGGGAVTRPTGGL